jgi:hypothetical protein
MVCVPVGSIYVDFNIPRPKLISDPYLGIKKIGAMQMIVGTVVDYGEIIPICSP